MAKKGNVLTLSTSPNTSWDRWGAACGFTSWDAAAAAIGMTKAGLFVARQRPTIRLQTQLAMAAVAAGLKPYTSDLKTSLRDTAPFYVLPREHCHSMVKGGDFFRSQGGLKDSWGEHWIPVQADSIEDARRLADRMVTKQQSRIWNSDAPGGNP